MEEATPEEPLLLRPAASGVKPNDTYWPCVANLSKVIIGAGMMAIPQAYYRIGSLAGTSMLVLVGLMTYSTLVFLLKGSAATGAATYSQLTRVLCGTAVMKVLQLAVLSFCFGFGVVYLVIIRDILLGTPPNCNGLLCELFGLSPTSIWADGRLALLAVALLVCSPLLLLRTMDRLAVLNVVGVSAIGMLALTAVGLAVKGLAQGTAHPIPAFPQWQQLGQTPAQQLQALMAVMPVMIACYVAHQSLHPLMPLLQPYTDAHMRGVIAGALLIAFGVFGSLAVGSSLAFGPTLEVNVLNNFSVTFLEPLAGPLLARVLSWTIRGGYLLSLLASLLLYMHPLRACLAEMLWPDKEDGTDGATAGPTHQHGLGPCEHGSATTGPSAQSSRLQGYASLPAGNGMQASSAGQQAKAGAVVCGRQSEEGTQSTAVTGSPGQQLRGSVFANPSAQAAAAAGGAQKASTSGGGGAPLTSSQSRQLSTFDSLDNPRTGSWSGVRYMQSSPEPGSAQQQQAMKVGGSRNSVWGPTASVPRQIQQYAREQQRLLQSSGLPAGGVRIIVTDAGPPHSDAGPVPVSSVPGSEHRWRQAEQRWYYLLTYGLLAAMVLVAIVVPNIWTALSAIGDLASTLQAFVVPGLIGIILTRRRSKLIVGSSVLARLEHWLSGGTGALAVFLGLVLFVNGIYQRL